MVKWFAVAVWLATSMIVNPPEQSRLSLIEPPAVSMSERFEEAVELWVSELSAQPEFSDWRKADWRKEPLGPGMHGWLVVISRDHQEIGYLIISAKPDGDFVLTEYGSWPITPGEDAYFYGLFEHSLSLSEHLAIRSNPSILAVEEAVVRPHFDPYYDLSWVTEEKVVIKDLQDLQDLLAGDTPLTYIAEIEQPDALFAYAVTGYHRWQEGSPYIRLEFEGIRYVPADTLLYSGRFHIARAEHEVKCPLPHIHDDEDV